MLFVNNGMLSDEKRLLQLFARDEFQRQQTSNSKPNKFMRRQSPIYRSLHPNNVRTNYQHENVYRWVKAYCRLSKPTIGCGGVGGGVGGLVSGVVGGGLVALFWWFWYHYPHGGGIGGWAVWVALWEITQLQAHYLFQQ